MLLVYFCVVVYGVVFVWELVDWVFEVGVVMGFSWVYSMYIGGCFSGCSRWSCFVFCYSPCRISGVHLTGLLGAGGIFGS